MKEKPMIVIDAGHGGDDPGAVGNGITEKDLTLKISQYMYNRFKDLGYQVKMTRTTDETISPTERVRRILAAYGNDPNVIVISNHINAGGGDGAEVIYALRNNNLLADLVLQEISKEGQNIRQAYQRRLPSNPSKDYYFIQRDTGLTQPITVEYGFLDSSGDDPQQLKTNYEAYTNAVVRAVQRYIGLETPNLTGKTYTVQNGDSLGAIANRYNTTASAIKQLNNLTSDMIYVGQVLRIPETSGGTGGSTGQTYTVKSGDSLYKIADRFGVTVAALRQANNLTSDALQIGQVLRIPSTGGSSGGTGGTTGGTYTVKSGDSLWSIANRYGITVDALKQANNLTSNALQLGQVLRIPSTGGTGGGTTGGTGNDIEYVVQRGDSLYTIANRYNTTADALQRYNNLASTSLSVGQVLRIPRATGNTYTVKSGDSLWSIANRYGITVDALKQKNNLTSNALQVGQVLTI